MDIKGGCRRRLQSVIACTLFFVTCLLGGAPLLGARAHMLHPRHHHKLYDSPYFSLHKTGRLPPIDFAEGREEDVNKALELRSFKNEIIILVFTRHSVRWMVHYARMCQALGFDHFIAVGSVEADCDLFRSAWCSAEFGGPGAAPSSADPEHNATANAATLCEQLYPGCAWISANQTLDGAFEWQHMEQRPVERLWLFRYWFALHALRRGVNSLISDLDVVIHGDFYAEFKAPPLDSLQFFQMPGSLWPNGGLIYIQNAHPEGPISYMLDESVRLGLAIYRHRHAEPNGIGPKTLAAYCSGNDQDTLEAAMLAAGQNSSIHEWRCLIRMDSDGVYESDFAPRWRSIFGDSRPLPTPYKGPKGLMWEQWDSTAGLGPRAKQKPAEELLAIRPMMPLNASRACAGKGQCDRLAEWARACLDAPPKRTVLWNPPEAVARGKPAMSEVAVSSPHYLLGDTNPIVYGWGDVNPHRTWALVNHLVAFGPTFGWSQHRRKGGGRHNRMHIIQAHGQWHAPLPLPRRLLRVSQSLVEAAAAQPTSEAFRLLIRSLMVASVVTRRTPVLPAVRCAAAAWIERSSKARHGYADPSFVTVTAPWKVAGADVSGDEESESALCAPYLSFWDDCNDNVVLSDFHIYQAIHESRRLSEATVLLLTGEADADAVAAVGEAAAAAAAEGGAGTGGEAGGARRALREATAGAEPEGAPPPSAAPAPSAREPFRLLREAATGPEGARASVLWLSGDLEAALRLSRDVPEMKANLGPREREELDRLCKTCPDFAYEERFLLSYR